MVNSLPELSFHHVGCLTNNIEESILTYRNVLGFKNVSEVFDIKHQQVKVCFIEIGPERFLELVEPANENVTFKKILKSNNPYYHVGYHVNNLEDTIDKLVNENCYLVNKFQSEAFGNNWCAFLYTPDMQLIELMEK